MDPGYKVVDLDVSKGRGVVATKSIPEDSAIFEEVPIVCCQFSWNAEYGYKACNHCMRPLETSEENARRLMNSVDLVLPFLECCPTNKSEHVPCSNCNARYCSDACRDTAWNQYHRSLCNGVKCQPNHYLNELNEAWKQIHYPPESASVMLLARIVALIEQSDDKESLIKVFHEFCHSDVSGDNNIAAQQLMGLYQDQIELIRSLFIKAVPHSIATEQWFTLEGFSSLLALVGANGQGVGTSVFSEWVSNVENLTLPAHEKESVDSLITTIYEKMDEHVGNNFLNNEGSALYSTQRFINHSCEPNAKITFPHGNSTLKLMSIREISPGEEICISYLDECVLERSRHSRQRILRDNYHFICRCAKCSSQIGDPDVTSSDEDDDDDEDVL